MYYHELMSFVQRTKCVKIAYRSTTDHLKDQWEAVNVQEETPSKHEFIRRLDAVH